MAHTSTPQKLLYCVVIAIFITVIVATSFGYLRSHKKRFVPIKSMDTWQQADVPLGYPLENKQQPPFDTRMLQLSAFERALIPSASRMQSPMGTRYGALTYNAQPFWANNKKRGGHHTGDDINGIGGMNTDLGDPIYAIANGLVIYRGEPSPGWGKTLILAHRSEDGSIHQWMYSHLDKINATPKELISVGEQIGTVGTANLNYPAHLHLERRHSSGVWIGSGYVNRNTEHLDPNLKINPFPKNMSQFLYTAPLLITKQEKLQQAHDNIFIQNTIK